MAFNVHEEAARRRAAKKNNFMARAQTAQAKNESMKFQNPVGYANKMDMQRQAYEQGFNPFTYNSLSDAGQKSFIQGQPIQETHKVRASDPNHPFNQPGNDYSTFDPNTGQQFTIADSGQEYARFNSTGAANQPAWMSQYAGTSGQGAGRIKQVNNPFWGQQAGVSGGQFGPQYTDESGVDRVWNPNINEYVTYEGQQFAPPVQVNRPGDDFLTMKHYMDALPSDPFASDFERYAGVRQLDRQDVESYMPGQVAEITGAYGAAAMQAQADAALIQAIAEANAKAYEAKSQREHEDYLFRLEQAVENPDALGALNPLLHPAEQEQMVHEQGLVPRTQSFMRRNPYAQSGLNSETGFMGSINNSLNQASYSGEPNEQLAAEFLTGGPLFDSILVAMGALSEGDLSRIKQLEGLAMKASESGDINSYEQIMAELDNYQQIKNDAALTMSTLEYDNPVMRGVARTGLGANVFGIPGAIYGAATSGSQLSLEDIARIYNIDRNVETPAEQRESANAENLRNKSYATLDVGKEIQEKKKEPIINVDNVVLPAQVEKPVKNKKMKDYNRSLTPEEMEAYIAQREIERQMKDEAYKNRDKGGWEIDWSRLPFVD